MSGAIGAFDTIVIVGVIQGIVAAAVVGFHPSGSAGKKLLSAILITLALLNIKILLHTLGLWQYPGWHYFPLAIDTLVQPLFYLYTCSLTVKNFSINRRQFWHFAPVIVFQLHAVIVYMISLSQPGIKDLGSERYLFYNAVKWMEDVAALFSAGIYWYLSFKKTQTYRRWLFSSQSATQYLELTWLRNLLIGTGILVAALFLSSLPANILGRTDSFAYLEFFYIYITMLIYFLSFRGYRIILTSEVQVVRLSGEGVAEQRETEELLDIVEKDIEVEKDFSDIQQALTEVMEKQLLFLEPELSLKDIAKTIGFPVGEVSAAINAGFGLNFRTWVNGYRVSEVKKRLDDPGYKHLSLTGIAFECGFNSEASFYRIFRQHTGHSPKSFLQEIKRKH